MDIKTVDLFAFPVYTPAMSDTARDYQTIQAPSSEGMDDLFDVVATNADTFDSNGDRERMAASCFHFLKIQKPPY